jgi:hypothetical protein
MSQIKNKTIKIGKAKGRPMLTWIGKRPLTSAKAYPGRFILRFSGFFAFQRGRIVINLKMLQPVHQ